MSELRWKIEDALKDIARMREANYTQLLPPKIEEALKLIDLLQDQWGIDLEEALGDKFKYFLEDETDPQQLYDKLCAAKVREDRNDLARKVLVERRQSSESNFSRRRRSLRCRRGARARPATPLPPPRLAHRRRPRPRSRTFSFRLKVFP